MAERFTADQLWELRNEIVRFQWQATGAAQDATHALLAHVEKQWRETLQHETNSRWRGRAGTLQPVKVRQC